METTLLSTSESLMLDIIRVLAAATVAFGHLTQPYFSTGISDQTGLARGSVAIFFVLSGFVIRHVTMRRAATFKSYMADRLSRIYSVAIPALLFTLVADSIARHANPAFYLPWAADATHPLWRVLVNLIFSGQLWQYLINPLSNSPYWSINYEMAYYIGYGCFFYLSGKSRWISITLLCLIFGYRVIFLCPLWIGGCVIHDIYQRWTAAGTTVRNINKIFGASFLLVVALAGLLVLHPAFRHPHLHVQFPAFMHDQRLRVLSYAFGFFWMLLFMRLLAFARSFPISRDAPLLKSVRFFAEGTFPIYLFHFPLYVLLGACIPYDHGSKSARLLIFLVAVVVGVFAGHPCNLLKDRLRTLWIPRRAAA